jgi:hypothetical protein
MTNSGGALAALTASLAQGALAGHPLRARVSNIRSLDPAGKSRGFVASIISPTIPSDSSYTSHESAMALAWQIGYGARKAGLSSANPMRRDGRMTQSEFEAITHELDQIVDKLKESKDPETRKKLLHKMRELIAKLNEIVFRLDPEHPKSP